MLLLNELRHALVSCEPTHAMENSHLKLQQAAKYPNWSGNVKLRAVGSAKLCGAKTLAKVLGRGGNLGHRLA